MAEITDDDTMAATTPNMWPWNDMVFLTAMNNKMTGGDTTGTFVGAGYKPRDPEDPRWLKALTALMFVLAVVAIPIVFLIR